MPGRQVGGTSVLEGRTCLPTRRTWLPGAHCPPLPALPLSERMPVRPHKTDSTRRTTYAYSDLRFPFLCFEQDSYRFPFTLTRARRLPGSHFHYGLPFKVAVGWTTYTTTALPSVLDTAADPTATCACHILTALSHHLQLPAFFCSIIAMLHRMHSPPYRATAE